MSRLSGDEIREGRVYNGFDYNLQLWVFQGVVRDCGHPRKHLDGFCCNARRYAGRRLATIPGHETREEGTE